jgi:outer membrane protein insertion porin family
MYSNLLKYLKSPFTLFFIAIILSGCMGTSLLSEKDYMLRDQKVKGTQKTDKQALKELFRQETNRQMFFFPVLPYVYFYEWGLRRYDQDKIRSQRQAVAEKFDLEIAETQDESKVEKLNAKKRRKLGRIDKKLEDGNMFMRWGEPISVLDSSALIATTEQMALYLKTKGFLESETDFRVKTRNKKARVIYDVHEGPPYLIDTVTYRTTDENISKILLESTRETLIKQRSRYDQVNLILERERIESLMRDNGYYDFSRQYIDFLVYDTLAEDKLAIEIIINNPKNGQHKIFKVDSVIFHSDERALGRENRIRTRFNGKVYNFGTRRFSEKMLDQRIFIRSGSLYSYNSTLETQRQLANLDNFKFINIYYDSTGGNFIANIYASPLNKYQTTNEVGLGIIVSEGFPSPFYNFNLKNRNIFGSLENMELSARIGIEGLPSATDASQVYKSTEAGGNFSLTFPQFALPLGSSLKRRLGNINPKTRATAGFTFTNRPEYQRNTFNTSLSYNWQKGLERQYNFTLVDLNLINSRNISREFQERLWEFERAGNKLINSFEPSFINSMAFSTTYNFNQYGFYTRKASLLKIYLENGGAFMDLSGIQFLSTLQHYKFYKAFIDYRGYRPMPKSSSLAFRTFLGLANPYGNTEALPYEKYFFAGGSNGIRAWRPRRLGPGSYTPTKTLSDGQVIYDDSFEQPADILFEASLELRKKLVGFLEGALFIDIGNSWTVKKDIDKEEETVLRPGADFSFDRFYQEIAVGTGFGVRFDFSFLIIRFDWGFKMYDPARAPGSRFLLSRNFNAPPFHNERNYTLNLGIGYPF